MHCNASLFLYLDIEQNYFQKKIEKARSKRKISKLHEKAKKFYNELADWEEDHYLAFEQQLAMLKEEYFQANNFVPM